MWRVSRSEDGVLNPRLLSVVGAGVAANLLGSAAAPAGSGVPGADGYAGAEPGLPQLPALLRHYPARPPWHVAGVDYAVGVPAGAHLRDPLYLAMKGVVVDADHHMVRIAGDDVTLDGYDFSLHGGWVVYIQSGAQNTVISHSRFGIGANNLVPVAAEAGTANLAILHNMFAGGGAPEDGRSGAVWTLVNYSGSGRFVAKYNWFGPAPADAIDLNNGRISADIEYNAAVSLGHAPGSHPDFVQFDGSLSENSVIAFNTIYQPQGEGEVSGMEGIQVEAQKGSHVSVIVGTRVSNNTIIATGPELAMSCAIAVIEDRGNRIDGVDVRSNYLDFRGAYFAFYPPSGANVVFSDNIDMTTGRRIMPPAPRRN